MVDPADGVEPTLDWLDVERTRNAVLHAMFGEDRPPVRVGRFEIVRTIGHGAMGRVYLGFDPVLDRDVAVKVIQTDADEDRSEAQRARLLEEARAIAKVDDPHVVHVYEAGRVAEDSDEIYVVMELVLGITLRRWQTTGERNWREVVDRYVAAGLGLAAAHRAGIAHRDFKPDNVLVADDGRVRVVDFGLARAFSELDPEHRPTRADGRRPEPALPVSTRGAGTPAYMAPEQLEGREASAFADQFAFCVALFEALHGQLPFPEDADQRRRDIERGSLVRVSATRVPRWLSRALARGLAQAPNRRWPSMNALLRALQWRTRRRRVWIAGAAVVGLCVAGSAAYGSNEPACSRPTERLDGIWDAEVRATTRAAFEGADVTFGPETWAKTEAILDRHADAWLTHARQSCEMQHAAPTSLATLHAECVDRNLRRFGHLTRILSTADDKVVRRAIVSATRLPAPGACDQLDRMQRRFPVPRDADLVSPVRSTRLLLEKVEVALEAGRVEDARAAADRALRDAEAIDYRPLLAEAQLALGKVLGAHRDDEAAREALESSFWSARQAGHDEVGLEAALWLTFVTGQWLARLDDARAWARHAEADIERLGSGAAKTAALATNLGAALSQAGEYDEARQQLEAAIDSLESARHPDVVELARIRNLLGIVHLRTGDLPAARRQLELARDDYAHELGDEHPDVAGPLQNLALVAQLEGDLTGARELLGRTLAIRTAAFGPEDSRVGEIENNLGALELGVGRYAAARPHLKRALDIYSRTRGERHPSVGITLYNLGFVEHRTGRLHQAVSLYVDATAVLEASYGAESSLLAGLYAYHAGALLELDRVDEATTNVEPAIAACAVEGTDPTDCAQVGFVEGQLRWAAGDRVGGLERVRRAREAYAEAGYQTELEIVEQWLEARE